MNTRRRFLLAACATLAVPLELRAQVPPHSAQPDAGEPPPRSNRTFGGVGEDHILDEIRTARILSRQQVGSTSVNYHLHLAGDIDCAYKPRSSTHGEAYRAEIAAFRLNRLLGLSRVPPAISRYIPRDRLHLSADTTVTVERDGQVRGASIYWVPVLRESRIDLPRERERWRGWLSLRGAVPADQGARAEEISTLVAFDFLTGNWDRWSGQNVPMDAAGHLVYRDNNGGFGEPFTEITAVTAHLRQVQKFSRGVIDRARALTDASVRAEMALDPDTAHPPLSAAQITSLLHRRDALMAYVDELVRRHDEASVYPWP